MAPSGGEKAAKRVALVVGIDDYPNIWALPLKGCCNDARTMAALLEERFDFRVRLLLDGEATRVGMLSAMEELQENLLPGARVVFHFSGHGSRILEPSGRSEESLLPQDSGRGEHPNRDITDRELFGWLAGLSSKTPYITLIMDSCHAGGIVRDLETGVRGVEADHRPEALAGKDAFREQVEAGQGALRSGTLAGTLAPGASGWLPWSDRYTLIAACKAQQSARELEDPETGASHGVLTYHLARSLSQIRGAVSYRDLFEPIAASIHQRYREQEPQLEGAWDREVFGEKALVPQRFVPVKAREGSLVTLDGGGAHGLVRGSECEIYLREASTPECQTPVGRVRVEDPRALISTATLLAEDAPGLVGPGTRAVEVERPPGLRRLAVRVVGPGEKTGELLEGIRRSPLLETEDGSNQQEDYTVHFLEPRRKGEGKVPVEQLGRLTWPTWAVVDGSGRQVMPPKAAATPGAVDSILQNLELWARYRALLELRPPDLENPLGDLMALELLRRRPGEEGWAPADPEGGGRTIFDEGARLGIRIEHGYETPLHVAVLDLGLTGSVSLLYPTRGRSRPLPPRLALDIGLDDQDPLELFVPQELPYPGETFKEAQEVLMLLASTEEADLSLLSQEGVRGVLGGSVRSTGVADSPFSESRGGLSSLLGEAVMGLARRDARHRAERSDPAIWAVKTRSFWLRRRS